MQPAVRDELLRVNRAFYQSLAGPFASTRRRPQPGVQRILSRIEPRSAVLDVGCGHGLVAAQMENLGHRGVYRGIDASLPLIDLARRRVDAAWASFAIADLAHSGWRSAAGAAPFDWVLAFAVLHHVPDASLRLQVAGELSACLAPEGTVAVSVWDFAGRQQFQRRMVAWDEIRLSPADVEPGDALLDWREGSRGIRYVHQFTDEELAELAQAAGLTVAERFHADGEGGQLGLYQLWRH